MFCKSGNHFWTDPTDAVKCCNGYKRLLVLGGGSNQQEAGGVMCGRTWVVERPPDGVCSLPLSGQSEPTPNPMPQNL
jgi:hypothetical protein